MDIGFQTHCLCMRSVSCKHIYCSRACVPVRRKAFDSESKKYFVFRFIVLVSIALLILAPIYLILFY